MSYCPIVHMSGGCRTLCDIVATCSDACQIPSAGQRAKKAGTRRILETSVLKRMAGKTHIAWVASF